MVRRGQFFKIESYAREVNRGINIIKSGMRRLDPSTSVEAKSHGIVMVSTECSYKLKRK
jgi:hypothetical protein